MHGQSAFELCMLSDFVFLLGKSHVAQSKSNGVFKNLPHEYKPWFFWCCIFLTYLCLNAGQKEPCPLTTCLGDGGDDDDYYDDDNDDDNDDDGGGGDEEVWH